MPIKSGIKSEFKRGFGVGDSRLLTHSLFRLFFRGASWRPWRLGGSTPAGISLQVSANVNGKVGTLEPAACLSADRFPAVSFSTSCAHQQTAETAGSSAHLKRTEDHCRITKS